jgi:hypothetical protein
MLKVHENWRASAVVVLVAASSVFVAVDLTLPRHSSGAANQAPSSPPAGSQLCRSGPDSSSLLGPSTAPTGAVTIPAGDNDPAYEGQSSFAFDTTYYFAAGVHTLGSSPTGFYPQTGDTFIGAPGAVIDGQGSALSAFDGDASNVTVEYLTVEHFAPTGLDQAVVNHDGGANWTIKYDTIGEGLGVGVGIGTGDVVSQNCLTDNDQLGFEVIGRPASTANVTVSDNEISDNDANGHYDETAYTVSYSVANDVATITTKAPMNLVVGAQVRVGATDACTSSWCTNLSDPALDGTWTVTSIPSATSFTFDVATPDSTTVSDTTGTVTDRSQTCGCSGGGIFSNTLNAAVFDNYVHDNGFAGIWARTDNAGFTFTGNYIVRNWAEGVIYDASYNASFTDNAFVDNAWGQGPSPTLSGFPDSALYLYESGDDTRVGGSTGTAFMVADNVFTDNWGGVVIYENADSACGLTSNDLCTLVDPTLYTATSCAAGIPGGTTAGTPDYVDNCRWKAQDVFVTQNAFNFTADDIGANCTTVDYCGFNGLFGAPGTTPSSIYDGPWPPGATFPYAGDVIANDISNSQNNHFADNSYCAGGTGSWNFVGFTQGNALTEQQWTSGEADVVGYGDGFGAQDAGSTFSTGECDSPTGGPTDSSSPAPAVCSGQVVAPADDVQSVVDQAPPGTTFCFAPGTYHVSSLAPKTGDVFDGGAQQAVLDGQNTQPYAIVDNGASGVTVRGFVIQNFATPLQKGAITAYGGNDWIIEDNDIVHNAAAGVATGDNVEVLDNEIEWNTQEGFSAHGSGGLYDGNEIAYNNDSLGVDPTWEAGGGKCWATTAMTFSYNYVHDNGGNGIWCDTNNIFTTIDHNTVVNNYGAGIYDEISYDGSITDNVVEDNGMPSSPGGGQRLGYLWDAGIQLRGSGSLSAASPFLISGNTVVDNYNGIALLQTPNDTFGACNTDYSAGAEGLYGPCLVQNVLVEDNTISMAQGASGAVEDGAGAGIFTTQNNHFVGNHYTVSGTCCTGGYSYGWLAWNDVWPSWAAWQGVGNDLAGSFGP